jgi:hypothetical protein
MYRKIFLEDPLVPQATIWRKHISLPYKYEKYTIKTFKIFSYNQHFVVPNVHTRVSIDVHVHVIAHHKDSFKLAIGAVLADHTLSHRVVPVDADIEERRATRAPKAPLLLPGPPPVHD